jgi:hypothetical protein
MFVGTEKVGEKDWLKFTVEELNNKLNKLEVALLRDKNGEEEICAFPKDFVGELKEFKKPEEFLGKLRNIFKGIRIIVTYPNKAERNFPVEALEAYVNHEKGEIYAIAKPEEYWEQFIEELGIIKKHFVSLGFKSIILLDKH